VDGRELVGLALVVALAVGGCDGETRSPRAPARGSPDPTESQTPNEASYPDVAVRLRDAPRDCPGPDVERSRPTRFYGPLIGKTPLWAGFYARLDRRGSVHAPDARKTPVGYRIKVLWIVGPRRRERVRVTGAQVASGEPILFSVFGRGGEVAVLDPDNADSISEHTAWREFPSYLFFPRAGCYEIRMVVGWRITFGFGR
jgi:hypothetical protein